MSSHPESGPCKTYKWNDIMGKVYCNKDQIYCPITAKYINKTNCYGDNCGIKKYNKDKYEYSSYGKEKLGKSS